MNAIGWLCASIAQILCLVSGAAFYGFRGFVLVLCAICAKSISLHCLNSLKNHRGK